MEPQAWMRGEVLIVDDEPAIRKLVEYHFQRAGFPTSVCADGSEAYERIRKQPDAFCVVILDIMLPGMDGLEVCRRLRQERIWVPIILLTAREEEVDRILGLELGADDYVTKPFSPRELVARARAVLRRRGPDGGDADGEGGASEVLRVGDIVLDPVRHQVFVRGEAVELTPKEFELLHYFMLNRDRVLSRNQLLEHVWGYAASPDTRIVDAHVSHLREKIEENPKDPVYLKTIRGVGYRLMVPGGTPTTGFRQSSPPA
ncbi:DNA-binding response regulator [Alicyclobacillus cellulosilyticus]|uniref:DNA-binding response regulator n=1 Tax=Alicyclobacillus cellulosilyticus TaxID=1003997 RepID=A0A917KDY1_9BACL|nr:response regulator transcription factor [Alicyclobacillus cellulosilyticus]GGJ09751.1 DNA-binding response regulator [Alicyclobacillus cellulosilyticus]